MSPNEPAVEAPVSFQPPRAPIGRAGWRIVPLIIAMGLLLVGAYNQAQQIDSGLLRLKLARWVVLDLRVVGLLLLAGMAWSARSWLTGLPRLTRGERWAVAGVCVLGLVLTAWVAPRTNRLYYDEHIYQNIAQTIAYEGSALVCNEGRAEYGEYRCQRGEYYKQPAAYPFLLSLAFQLAGVREAVAFTLNNLAFAGSILVVFGLGRVLFHSTRLALFSALIFALIPLNLRWGNTVAGEPTAVLGALLSVFATAVFARRPAHATALCAVAANALAVQFRSESILILPVNGVLLLALNRRLLFDPRFYAWAFLGLLLILPHLGHLVAVRGENWGSTGEKFSAEAFRVNFPVNSSFYGDNQRFPALFTVLALVGIFRGGGLFRKLPLLLWFVLFWGVFLFFYAGSYNYGVDERFSLLSYAPLALLAGRGAHSAANWLAGRLAARAATAATAAMLVASLVPLLPMVRAEGEEAWAARVDVAFARRLVACLPENSMVLTHNPSLFLLAGKNAAQMSLVTTEKPYVDDHLFARYDGGVFLHWNYWCNVPDPLQSGFAETVLDLYVSTLVTNHSVRNFTFALYRLEKHPVHTEQEAAEE